jgi:NADPH2:quinone reductase
LTGPTSYAALVLRANTQPGDWALIHGAAGGVGLAAVQVAKALGAEVIATATSERNIAVLKSVGADHVIDYVKYPQWEAEVQKITKGHGADVVFDPVGTISQSMKCVAFGARLVPIGFVGGQIEAVKVNRILLKNVSVAGLHWGLYATEQPETVVKVWEGLFDLIKKG